MFRLFEGFFAKKYIHFREILNYILFKIFSIASYNFFPFFWQQVNSIIKKCLSFEAIYSSGHYFFIFSYVLKWYSAKSCCIDRNKW